MSIRLLIGMIDEFSYSVLERRKSIGNQIESMGLTNEKKQTNHKVHPGCGRIFFTLKIGSDCDDRVFTYPFEF